MVDYPVISIGTHDGNFHADEVLAVAILTTIFPNHVVYRSRDEDILSNLDILVDVGGIYDHDLRRYDHHLPNPPRDPNGHLYSSAGLVWLHYGKSYLRTVNIPKDVWLEKIYLDLIDVVERQIRVQWIYPIDRSDNGVSQGPTPISEIVNAMRPIDAEKTRERYTSTFFDCVSLVANVFKRSCFHAVDHAITQAKYNSESKTILSDGRIIVTDHSVRNYKSFRDTPVHFVISTNREYIGSDPYYIIRSVMRPDEPAYKTSFPSSLLGRSKEEIGIDGITYIHHGGYMAHASSQEAAIHFCQSLLDTTVD